VACIVHWHGACEGAAPYAGFTMAAYAGALNRNVLNCNTHPDRAFRAAFAIPLSEPDVLDMPCEQATRDLARGLWPYNMTQECSFLAPELASETCQARHPAGGGATWRGIVFNMPGTCPYYGLGTEGVQGGRSVVWVASPRMQPQWANTVLHEFGHTWSLSHAHSAGSAWEYADKSDPMGCADTIGTCFNAPNAHALGWNAPLAVVAADGATQAGRVQTFVLPVATTAYANHVQVTSLFGSTRYVVFLSLRSSLGTPLADAEIAAMRTVNHAGAYVAVQNAVSIHAVDAGDPRAPRTWFVDAVQPGAAWDELEDAASSVALLGRPRFGLRVALVSFDAAALRATVTVTVHPADGAQAASRRRRDRKAMTRKRARARKAMTQARAP
jgi:hypothetical protein